MLLALISELPLPPPSSGAFAILDAGHGVLFVGFAEDLRRWVDVIPPGTWPGLLARGAAQLWLAPGYDADDTESLRTLYLAASEDPRHVAPPAPTQASPVSAETSLQVATCHVARRTHSAPDPADHTPKEERQIARPRPTTHPHQHH